MADEKKANKIDVNDVAASLQKRVAGFEAGVKAGKITSDNFDARKLFTSFRSTLPAGGENVSSLDVASLRPSAAGANIACDEGCGGVK